MNVTTEAMEPEEFCTAHPGWNIEVRSSRPWYRAVRGTCSVTGDTVEDVDAKVGHCTVPGDALVVIAKLGDLERAARRVQHQVAPTVTA